MLRKIYWVILIMPFILISIAYSQEDSVCPEIPDGLARVGSIMWLENDQSILVSIGENHQNSVLGLWLEWNINRETLMPITVSDTVSILQLADRLNLYEEFLSGQSIISISPEGNNAIIVTNGRLFAVETQGNLELIELGMTSENLASLEVHWVNENEIIVVVEPIYGESTYQILRVCVDGSCFDNISQSAGDLINEPSVDLDTMQLIFQADNDLILYDLQASTMNELPLNIRTIPSLNPIKSNTSEKVFLIGFDEIGVSLNLYEIDIATGNLQVVVNLESDIEFPSSWLISESERYMIFVDPGIRIQCY